jgi:hypothetical protein
MLTSMLFQTTVTPNLPTIADEIALHPYLFLGILGGLATLTLALFKWTIASFESRVTEKFTEVQNREGKQEERLDKAEQDLQGYDKHVALGAKESAEITTAIQRVERALTDHTRKEETVTWAKIDDLVTAVTDMKLSNEVAHERLAASQAVISTRVEALESAMPNGEIAQLRLAIKSLVKKPTSKKRK